MNDRSLHFRAVCQALLVTFLWSTSIILIKIGLKEIPALTFAGLRYTLAFLCLLPFAILAWIFLGEKLTWRGVLGMMLAAVGALLVQIRRQRAKSPV